MSDRDRDKLLEQMKRKMAAHKEKKEFHLKEGGGSKQHTPTTSFGGGGNRNSNSANDLTSRNPSSNNPSSQRSAKDVEKNISSITAQTNENITRAIRITEQSNEHATIALGSLGRQKETIGRSITNVEDTHDHLSHGKRILRDMRMTIVKEKVMKALIITFLLLAIFVIVYVRWFRSKK